MVERMESGDAPERQETDSEESSGAGFTWGDVAGLRDALKNVRTKKETTPPAPALVRTPPAREDPRREQQDNQEANEPDEPNFDFSRTLYEMFDLSSAASTKDIKKALRKAAKKYHPDKRGGDDRLIKAVNRAREVLLSEDGRGLYDAALGLGYAPQRALRVAESLLWDTMHKRSAQEEAERAQQEAAREKEPEPLPEDSFYSILGVAQDASPQDIVDAFQQKWQNAEDEETQFQVKMAYQVLSGGTLRALHDKQLAGEPLSDDEIAYWLSALLPVGETETDVPEGQDVDTEAVPKKERAAAAAPGLSESMVEQIEESLQEGLEDLKTREETKRAEEEDELTAAHATAFQEAQEVQGSQVFGDTQADAPDADLKLASTIPIVEAQWEEEEEEQVMHPPAMVEEASTEDVTEEVELTPASTHVLPDDEDTEEIVKDETEEVTEKVEKENAEEESEEQVPWYAKVSPSAVQETPEGPHPFAEVVPEKEPEEEGEPDEWAAGINLVDEKDAGKLDQDRLAGISPRADEWVWDEVFTEINPSIDPSKEADLDKLAKKEGAQEILTRAQEAKEKMGGAFKGDVIDLAIGALAAAALAEGLSVSESAKEQAEVYRDLARSPETASDVKSLGKASQKAARKEATEKRKKVRAKNQLVEFALLGPLKFVSLVAKEFWTGLTHNAEGKNEFKEWRRQISKDFFEEIPGLGVFFTMGRNRGERRDKKQEKKGGRKKGDGKKKKTA